MDLTLELKLRLSKRRKEPTLTTELEDTSEVWLAEIGYLAEYASQANVEVGTLMTTNEGFPALSLKLEQVVIILDRMTIRARELQTHLAKKPKPVAGQTIQDGQQYNRGYNRRIR